MHRTTRTWHYPIVLGLAIASAALGACGGGDEGFVGSLVSADTYDRARTLTGVRQSRLLRYRMPAVRGGLTEAKALLFVPVGTAPAGGWPLVAWAHGTVGASDGCAPSRLYDDDGDKPVTQALLNAGFAVVAPDYEGLGVPGAHPYLNLRSLGRSITAAVRAAHAVPDIALTRDWSVIGHSQGGFAALAAAQLAPDIEADFPLRATVALSPGTDPARTAAELFGRMDAMQAEQLRDPTPERGQALVELVWTTAFNGALFANGLAAQDPSLDTTALLEPGFRALASATLEDPDCSAFPAALMSDLARHVELTGMLSTYPAVRRNAFANAAIANAAERNHPGTVKLGAPVLVVQGDLDLQTPVGATRHAVARMRAVGTAVDYVEVAGAGHEGVVQAELGRAIGFIRARMAP